jgi:lipoprotein NlpD
MFARLSGVVFPLALLVACSTEPVNAPVDSIVALPKTRPAASTSSGEKPGHYTVRRGDTLYSIAWQNGVNFRQLADMNAIRSPYTIYVGQSLRIAPEAEAAPPPSPVSVGGPVATPLRRPVVAARPERGTSASPAPSPGPGAAVATAPVPDSAPVPETEPVLPAVVSRWVWPTRGPLLKSYTPEANGKKGIDIGGKPGQPVMAAADGKVVYSGSGLVGYGRLIIIKHNDNLLSAYGHNSELLVAEGDYVKAGQVIAKMGSSGTSSVRLYFEIRQDGKPVNPLRYLPRS